MALIEPVPADADEDPGKVAVSLDALIDELNEALAEGNLDQAIALGNAADIVADQLLELFGEPDEDDVDTNTRSGVTTLEMRALAPGDLRAEKNDDGSIGFRGHAAVFGSPTWIGPPKVGFWEQVSAGAFADAIQRDDVRFLIDHDPSKVLARTKNGTLRLSEDDKGLAVDADLAPTSLGKDLEILLKRGDISQMSFAFQVVKDSWGELDSGDEIRTLEQVKLFDVSAVTYPAYEDTTASLRSCDVARARNKGSLAVLRLKQAKLRLYKVRYSF